MMLIKHGKRTMRLIFCADPLNARKPDPAYAEEIAAAEHLGVPYDLVSYEALVNGHDPQQAVRRVVKADAPESGVYRGWMLRPEEYTLLYQALAERGVRLINDPAAYRHTHYLPESYSLIQTVTPGTVWIESGPDVDMKRVMAAVRPFGDAPIIVKDFVKSEKHEWATACYIPSAGDRQAVERVVRRFVELRGPDLNEGLVFREFVPFASLATHSQSGMPLSKEFRVFFLDGEPILNVPYWDEGDYAESLPPVARFQSVAATVRSRFFTMDLAQRQEGDWMIVELGDGQVAGLPDKADITAFYQALQRHFLPERPA